MLSLNAAILPSENLSKENIEWLEAEGFTEAKNDSYFYKDTQLNWENRCLHKSIFGDKDIHIWIFPNVIGVDIDYDCGGNIYMKYWLLENTSFENAYNEMVKYVEIYR